MNHSLKKTLVKVTTFCILIGCICLPSQAQLSGEVDLGGGSAESDTASGGGIKEITVIGIGTTLESAEKQALAAAIRQAVGAYIDSKTLVENEVVIQDRILAVSNAFVEGYETIGQPKKSADGLIEITIVAKVKTNQIVQKLKEVNLISGEVAGQNLWAEASTKVMNAKDALEMLEIKIPELIKSVVTLTPLDKDGQPSFAKDSTGAEVPSTAPAQKKEDFSTGEVELTWFVELGVDQAYYRETFYPMVRKCLDAIMGVPAKEFEINMSDRKRHFAEGMDKRDTASFYEDSSGGDSSDSLPVQQIHTRLPYEGRTMLAAKFNEDYGILLLKSISRNIDSMEAVCYPNFKNAIHTGSDAGWRTSKRALCHLKVTLLAKNDEVLATEKIPCWQPFATESSLIGMVGPGATMEDYDFVIEKPIVQKLSIKIPIELLKEIKKVDISLDPIKPNLELIPSRS